MISVEEALQEVLNHSLSLASEEVRLRTAPGSILAEDVFAPIDHPIF